MLRYWIRIGVGENISLNRKWVKKLWSDRQPLQQMLRRPRWDRGPASPPSPYLAVSKMVMMMVMVKAMIFQLWDDRDPFEPRSMAEDRQEPMDQLHGRNQEECMSPYIWLIVNISWLPLSSILIWSNKDNLNLLQGLGSSSRNTPSSCLRIISMMNDHYQLLWEHYMIVAK